MKLNSPPLENLAQQIKQVFEIGLGRRQENVLQSHGFRNPREFVPVHPHGLAVLGRGAPQVSHDLEHEIAGILALVERRVPQHHLAHHHRRRPHVHLRRVPFRPHQQLGRPELSRPHVGSVSEALYFIEAFFFK